MKKLLIGIGIVLFLLFFVALATRNSEVPEVETEATYVSSVDLAKAATKPTVDTQAAKKLKPSFNFKKDEYSGFTWIRHKAVPKYVNANAIYCYWEGSGDKPGPLRFRVQYLDDDWLFIENMIFLIDGQTYRYTPMKVEHDNEDGDIWEWSDEIADKEATDVIQALAGAKKAKVKFYGSKYFDERTIPAAQIKAVKESLQLYLAMGGVLEN